MYTQARSITLVVSARITIIGTGSPCRIKAGIRYFIALVITLSPSFTGVYKRMKNAAPSTTLVISIAENTIIADSTVCFGLRFTGIGRFVAHAVITLISSSTAVPRQTATDTPRALITHRAEKPVVTG
jgi:hypothetical protein